MPNTVVLTAGYAHADHVLASAELLTRDGVKISAIIVVSAFKLSRLKKYAAQYGICGVVRKISSIFTRRLAPSRLIHSLDKLSQFLENNHIAKTSLRNWAKHNGVPYYSVSSLNSNKSLNVLIQHEFETVIYGGGGILGKKFISLSQGRIINAHSGPLPEIRGMNACEWSILLGYNPAITIHFIDRGIDTGQPIARIPIIVEGQDTIKSLRDKCTVAGIKGIVENHDAALNLETEKTKPRILQRQCFVLAPVLRELLEYKIEKKFGS